MFSENQNKNTVWGAGTDDCEGKRYRYGWFSWILGENSEKSRFGASWSQFGASSEPVWSQFGASFANFQGLDLRAQRELDDAPGIRDLLHVLNFRAEPVRRSKNQKQKSKSKSRGGVLFSL